LRIGAPNDRDPVAVSLHRSPACGSCRPARFMTARAAVVLAFLIAALCALPTLAAPPFADDVVHEVKLENLVPGTHWGPLDLYGVTSSRPDSMAQLREAGPIPWFAAPDMRFRLFRPLSSASLALDHWLFGRRTWPARLDSLVWFFVIIGFAAAFYRRTLSPGTAALATILYAAAGAHAVPVSWIAARHALVGTALALAACWCYARGEEGWRPGRWLGPVAFVIALLASEMALGAAAIIGAWELLGRQRAIAQKIGRLAPYALVGVAYLAWYRLAGYGVRGSTAYLDPTAGWSIAAVAARHLGILVGEMVTGVPSALVGSRGPLTQTIAAALGATAALVAWIAFRIARSRVPPLEVRTARWCAVAAVAAALPGTLVLPSGRTLTLALVPAAVVMSIVILRGLQAVRAAAVRGTGRVALAAIAGGLAVALLAGGVMFRVRGAQTLARLARAQQALASSLPPCAGTMVIVNASDPTVAHLAPAMLALRGQAPRRLRLLSMSPAKLRIEEVTRTGFQLAVIGRPRPPTTQERIFRSTPVPVGTHVSIAGLDVTVLEGTSAPDDPQYWEGKVIRFDFGEPLDSPDLCFIQWTRRGLERLAPPRPGQVIDIPLQFGPLGW
jgi:hypothetical protein